MDTIYGFKSIQSQSFVASGERVPTTAITTQPLTITRLKSTDRDSYSALQIAIGQRKRLSKPILTAIKGHISQLPRFLREISPLESQATLKPGDRISPADILKPGDMVNVTSISKGKGFAGVVKRHGFKGGPRTHGQSDRHRAPGSIGQTTTPGRVYKGKRMAGRMGGVQRTQRNLTVLAVTDTAVLLKGTTPGPLGGLTSITKIGQTAKFSPLREVPTS